jgi:GR25 family glycosyltransferase involved in LPS biosynthesis
MLVGITVHFQFSFFSAGSPITALSIAELFSVSGHAVKFIRTGKEEDKTWYDDVSGLKNNWESVPASQASGFDLVIELGNNLLTVDQRKKQKGRCVWLFRKHVLYHDIEASLFPFENPDRDLEGISEVWLHKELANTDDVQYMETLARKPVRLLPLVWTPSAIELYRQQSKVPVWGQVAELAEVKEQPWSIHICETNNTSASSCTMPLFIMREIKKKSSALTLRTPIKIHNAEHVRDSQFFRFNVLDHAFSDIPDMSGVFLGRQRVADFVFDPKSILIAHARFLSWRPYLMDALWCGIPLVHNSIVLRDRLGDVGKLGFYPDNELHQGRLAFERVTEDAMRPGNLERLVECRKRMIAEFSPLNTEIQQAWCTALSSPLTASSLSLSLPSSPSTKGKRRIVVGFTDMWDDFNPTYNQFTLMLKAAVKDMQEDIEIVGQAGYQDANLVLFGPFGNTWQQAPPSVPKVHYTGENTPALRRDDIKLNIGYQHVDINDGNYLRIPLWMLEINWFGGDVEKIRNPKPMPINRATQVFPEELARKQKFCSFVVTNPCQPMRNSAFQWLTQYKHIDSGGRLFNNIGDRIFAGLGGGGGELKKLEFFKDYKFALTYENASEAGYTTEKMLHAKAAGCIPIYWGDPKVERDFDPAGFIDAREALTSSQLIDLVKEVDTNKTLWLKKFAVPALDEVRRDLVRRTLSECARRFLSYVGISEENLAKIPKFLGAACDEDLVLKGGPVSTEPGSPKALEDKPDVSAMKKLDVHFDSTVFATGCNTKFLSSLQLWLNSLSAHKQETKEITVIVYLMADVTKEAEQTFIETFPFAQFRRFPAEVPDDFKDLWAPEHFAWKIWLLRQLVLEEGLKGKPILYMDSGMIMVRWPRQWLEIVRRTGISLLEDDEQINKNWCHEQFRKAFDMTQKEEAEQQLWAGCMAFVSGHEAAKEFFEESWKWAQKREVIQGPKWSGITVDGKPYGHRHDQSILSLISSRMKLHRFPLRELYCHVSLRQTFLSQRYLYVHRGMFKVHERVAQGIDDAWVINLDRRKDRLETFKKTHPLLADRVLRLPAFEGKNLKLTPNLARLFAPHDFNWKKPVMGCALSHLALWMQLLNEKPDIETYLILEDDARLKPEWRDRWDEAMQAKAIPENFDVVYLGGILPPNREAFDKVCVEKLNDHVAKVAVNSVFGQDPPNRYFHFCAYAYVLSRTGARKVVEYLKSRNGYWTSADHMMCNLQEFLNIYFLHPFTAGCFQDDDPVYQKSSFNDFSRVDTFDSDLWNNTERFSEEEVASVLDLNKSLDILGALEDARTLSNVSAVDVIGDVKPEEAKETLVSTTKSQTQTVGPLVNPTLPKLGKRRLVSLVGEPMDSSKWYEFNWFKQIFVDNAGLSLEVERLADGSAPPTDEPIVVVQRNKTTEARDVLKRWNDAGAKFYVLHLSDEHGTDPVDFYDWPCCLGVLRNYVRPDVRESDKVKVIPLGFHWAIPNGEPALHTPRVPFRELVWSFVGTGWAGRRDKLQILNAIPGEHKCVFMEEWNSEKMLGREELLSVLLNTWCVPCPGGNNAETYRVYEALEAGAVPVLVKEGGMDAYLDYLGRWLPLLVANNWEHAAGLIHTLRMKPEVYEQYRMQILAGWEKMKADTRQAVRSVWKV